MRKRAGWLLCGFAVVLALGTASVVEGEDIPDVRSANMTLIANYDDGGTYRAGTDLAFWGNTLIAGALDQNVNPAKGGFRVMDISNPAMPTLVGRFECWGDQSDVSVWHDLVILSVDKPMTKDCSAKVEDKGGSFEGIRIVSIADPTKPDLLETADVATHCGSHTHTIVPDRANDRLLVYVLSYPLAGRYNPPGALPTCNPVSHGKISVVEIPLDNPAAPKLLDPLNPPSVRPAVGCHDVTVFVERDLAAAACLTESQLWDISVPAKPKVIAHIPNPPGMNLSHSTTFSNDGRTLVIGDELGGAAASPGCMTGSQEDVPGGLFFFDVTDASAPRYLDAFKLPRQRISEFCTAHQFNVVPLPDNKDVLVSSWYTGATSVIDFTDVRDGEAPEEIAWYIPEGDGIHPADDPKPTEAAAWASYWYRGYVWSSNFDEDVNSVSPRSRGLDVFEVKHPLVKKALKLRRLNPQVQERLPQSTG